MTGVGDGMTSGDRQEQSGDGSEARGDSCRSSRGWIIGEGHVDVREARLRSVQEIEELEVALVAVRRDLVAADEAYRAALNARQRADAEVEKVEARLRSARREAVYRLSSSSDISRPQAQRGADHDLDDTLLDEASS